MFDLGTSFGGWHRELWDGRIRDLRKLVQARLGFAALGSFVSSAMTAVALGIVAWLAAEGSLSLADASVGILGVQRLSGIARRLNGHLASLDRGGREMRDYDRFIDEAHDARELLVGEAPPEHVDEIELHDVSFSYLDAPHRAVAELTTSIRSGEVTAIVGPNGSGKSTLMMLLCGLYEPDEGSISWDGKPVSTFHPERFRDAIAPMFQDFTRFQLSVRDNVTLGEPDGRNDDVAIHEVLDIVGAGPAVDALGAGIDTELSRAWENGTELSAGQWQRLAAARALFRDAPLILLDEPSADLDALAEQALIDELMARSANRCVVFISHRFSAVRKADRILVMHEGRLVEDGSHRELMDGAGLYSVMYRTQTGLDA